MGLISSLLYGQSNKFSGDYTVQFKTGNRYFPENAAEVAQNGFPANWAISQGSYHLYLQFYEIPTQAQRERINASGIQLQEYIPHKTYVAAIPVVVTAKALRDFGVRSVAIIPSSDKIDLRVFTENEHKEQDRMNLLVTFFQDINLPTAEQMALLGMDVKGKYYGNTLIININEEDLNTLAALPNVRYIEPVDAPGKAESTAGAGMHRSNYISDRFDGTGIINGVFDDGFVGPHIDFKGRTNQTDVAGDLTGNHGDMVAGIVGGAGNLDPRVPGMAPGSFIYILQYGNSNATVDAIDWFNNDDVLIFNASYSNGCNAGYTNTTVSVDDQMFDNPFLLQCYSAGNNNGTDCGYGAGTQWGNITGGHKMGKNCIASANLDQNEGIVASSSRGPANDGRIKPDISSNGNGQQSTDSDNTYQGGSGTSAASPGTMGVATQLYEAYRFFNGGSNPDAGLIKACMLNGADEKGNIGPDFIYGWGRVNARQALRQIEENTYLSASVAQGSFNNHNITIPAGIKEARIMVYWTDPAGTTAAAYALVNDLDMTVTTPSASTLNPWVLNATPNASALNTPATTGVDNRNNVEQVAIQNPAAGTYTVRINGSIVPQGPQEYFIVYIFIEDEIVVTYPKGGEGFVPGEQEYIYWDALGTTGNFVVQYSNNNGASWANINGNVNGASRQVVWQVPANFTGQALVRVSRGTLTGVSEGNFSIAPLVQNIEITSVCAPDQITLSWDPVTGATAYDVFLLGAQYMDSVGTTTGTSLTVTANVGQEQWFSVRPRGPNNLVGRRANAVQLQPSAGPGGCYLDCNVSTDAGVRGAFPSGTLLNCTGSTNVPVTATLENLGPNPQSNFSVSYRFDAQTTVTETFTGTLPGNSTVSYTFTSPIANLSSGNHTLSVWTDLSGDLTTCNDTLDVTINAISAAASNTPYAENFEQTALLPANWQLINPDNQDTWTSANVLGINGTTSKCMRMDNYNYNAAGQEDILMSYVVNLANGGSPVLTFDVAYAYYSATLYDGLRVEISDDCGQTYNQIYFKEYLDLATIGQQGNTWTPSTAGAWRTDSVDLTAYAGSQVIFRFININGYGNMLYLDNINVIDNNAAPQAVIGNTTTTVCPIQSITFSDNSVGNIASRTWSFNPSTVTFLNGTNANSANPVVTFNNPGTYSVNLTVTNAVGFNTATQTITVNNGTALPIAQSFEAIAACATTANCAAEACNLTGNWTNESNSIDGIDWRTDAGGTPSSNTGPSIDHTLGTAAGKYIYLESSNCFNETANLLSPCLDLTTATSAQLSFWYHLFGSTQGELHVDIYTNGTWTNDIVPAISGDQGDQWRQQVVNLNAYVGQLVQLRIRGLTGAGNFSDMALDDINLDAVTSTTAFDTQQNISIFPNPSSGTVNLVFNQSTASNAQVFLYDAKGSLLMASELSVSAVNSLDVSAFSNGLYLLKVVADNKQSYHKLTIQQ
jgi:PKD repeat protein